MVDSSYTTSENSKDEKLRALDKRVKLLANQHSEILAQIKKLKSYCLLEAGLSCLDCLLSDKKDNISQLKDVVTTQELSKEIEWGAFWLHTGKKGN